MIDPAYQNEPILIVEQTGQIFPLSQELVTIGRKSGNTIVLGNDLRVSRHHATIHWRDGRYFIRDVGSSNGTFVNGTQISELRQMESGDLIEVGDTTFRVKFPLDETEPRLSGSPAPPVPASARAERVDTDHTLMRVNTPPPSNNPYVGPRTFTQEESDRFFGRETEARELLSLVISERLVLFYAQSGAGKSSLINTRLVPQLRQANFPVLPIGRVSGSLPEGIEDVDNIYIFNLLLSMDESDGNPKRFTQMTLTDFLVNLTSLDGTHYYYDDTTETNEIEPADLEADELYEDSPYVLIIDQFEEIVTTHPDRWQEREGFFRQLAQAMADDPMLWVVLTLREDYIAPLDPYTHLLPGKLRARFYMQRMDYEAALEAVKRPAANYGRAFASGVAESLVDNLRQIRIRTIDSPDQVETTTGQFIEPVQLQVVCFQMWENLKHRPLADITHRDLIELGDVDKALGQFYEQALARVLTRVNVSEIELRNWFETQLITEAGTKGTVYQGAEQTGGIPNAAVMMLADQYLLRAEVRAGGTWYELVHDRLVTPILQANQAWRLEQPLLQIAQAWIDAERNPAMLLEKQQLKRALEGNWRGLGPQVEEFIEASQTAQRGKDEARLIEQERLRQQELEQAQALAEEQRKRAELQAETTASLRRRAWLLGIFFAAGVILAIVAATFAFLANQNRIQALSNAAVARTEQARAVSAQQTAQTEATAAALNANAYQNVLQNQNATQTAEAESMMDESEAEAQELALQADSLEATITAEAALYASAVEETDTVELPTELPTPSETSAPPIYTPTTTPTSTPDLSPTQTAQARATELAQVRVEQTRVAQQVAAPLQECQIEAQGVFNEIATRFQERLGCPSQAEPVAGFFAEQPFQNGIMYWSSILELFFVLTGDLQEGQWRLFTKADVDSFNPNPDGVACEAAVPEGLIQPIRGFGAIWCAQEEIRRTIGFGTEDEYGVTENLLQLFENGYILRDNQNRIFVLLNNGVYLRVE